MLAFPPKAWEACPSPPPHQHLLFLLLWTVAVLTGVRSCLLRAVIGISLTMRDAEHGFLCLLAIRRSSRQRCLFLSPVHYRVGL